MQRLTLASLAILASAGVYFLFLSAWLNIYLLFGLLKWMKLGIIGVAIGAGLGTARWHVDQAPRMMAWPTPLAPDNHWVRLARV